MIDREYGKYIPVCDGCGRTLPAEDTFQDAVDAMKDAMWTARFTGVVWENFCMSCQEEM